jgi:hypothetical protein
LKPFALKKHQDASAWMQYSQLFIWFRKSNKGFSYTIFPVKKINVGEVLKLLENCYLIFLSIHILKLEISGCDKPTTLKKESHPEIRERLARNIDSCGYYPKLINFPHIDLPNTSIPNMLFYPP